jgi:hypothetical protein
VRREPKQWSVAGADLASICGVLHGQTGLKKGVHSPLKKSDFFLFFRFDLLRPRTYNPRPRCFAAVADEVVLPLNSDAKIV